MNDDEDGNTCPLSMKSFSEKIHHWIKPKKICQQFIGQGNAVLKIWGTRNKAEKKMANPQICLEKGMG